ncbi:hypothetical protein Cni_G11275 [Canna indica]|uniref:Uncharacterized protein n=1 Tax=Canna indica TaxID=4628 RepID=A0AAQ3Q805_9LILI|nr:hypothetical protein Cni_G11275 [Canna indica]
MLPSPTLYRFLLHRYPFPLVHRGERSPRAGLSLDAILVGAVFKWRCGAVCQRRSPASDRCFFSRSQSSSSRASVRGLRFEGSSGPILFLHI